MVQAALADKGTMVAEEVTVENLAAQATGWRDIDELHEDDADTDVSEAPHPAMETPQTVALAMRHPPPGAAFSRISQPPATAAAARTPIWQAVTAACEATSAGGSSVSSRAASSHVSGGSARRASAGNSGRAGAGVRTAAPGALKAQPAVAKTAPKNEAGRPLASVAATTSAPPSRPAAAAAAPPPPVPRATPTAPATDVVAGEGSGAASLTFCASPAANLTHLRVAVAQHESDTLLSKRKYWYKPVAILGGNAYSISEGEALAFKMGKRMLAAHEGATARGKSGFLVYDCAARALQAALVRPKGKLASATKAVLRVTVC